MAPLPALNSPVEGQSPGPRPTATGERLLVIPFADGIGDFVMMLPLLEAIRRRWPAAAVTVAASQRSRLLLDEDQERAFAVRTPSWLQGEARPRGGPLRKLLPQPALASMAGLALRAELGRFDRTLNLFQWWERGMDFASFWTPQVPPRPGATHSLDFLADRLGHELGAPITPGERRPRAQVRAAAAAWAGEWWRAAGFDGRRVVALVP